MGTTDVKLQLSCKFLIVWDIQSKADRISPLGQLLNKTIEMELWNQIKQTLTILHVFLMIIPEKVMCISNVKYQD